ncbi:MAG TPA: efflux RND transporter periplasmic adaptor subunit [Thermoanaerobaculia bacterium]|jgi:HlyD family secretion protein|nr:efflux RND transporter periplasmic adaptor subunit [Thermoanaerobaculia bacterium]
MTRTALLTGALVALAACGGDPKDPNLLVASGHVEATDVRLSTKVAGRLQDFGLAEGDTVRPGQPIAQIETTDIDLAVSQARAERQAAEAELALRLAGSREEDVAAAAAQVTQAQADLSGAEKDFGRMQGLLDRGSGTPKARDDARTRRDMAAARLKAARETLARLKNGSRPEEIAAARARVGVSDARIAQLEQQRSEATIISPAAGVVTEKIAEAGELLQAGSPLCVITDLTHAWLTVYIGEPDLGRIRIGQEAEVVTDDGQTRRGRITFVASKAEFTPRNVQTRDERVKLVYKVKVGLDNRDGLFKPGMPAEARFRVTAGAEKAASR